MTSSTESDDDFVDIMAECMQTDLDLPPLPENITADNCDCNDFRYLTISVCDCDYPDWTSQPIPIDEVLAPGIIYALIFLIGTFGNSLVIFVVKRYKRMRNVTNVFLASLSTADLCLIWFCVPIQYIKFLSHTWILGSFICYALHYVQQFSMACSVLTLTTISIERYMAIAYPMKTAWLGSIGRAKKVIIIIWITAASLAAPTAVRLEYIKYTTQFNRTIHYCLRQFPLTFSGRDDWEKAHALYQFILFLVIPLCTMTICYTRISMIVYSSSNDTTLRKSTGGTYNSVSMRSCRSGSDIGIEQANVKRKFTKKKSSGVIDSNRKQIVHMLIAIVMLYTACWTPYLVDDLLVGFGLICGTSIGMLKYLRMTFKAMAYCQSCINPIVYAFMSQNFRTSFVTAWRSWWRKRSLNERNRLGSQSSMTLLSQRIGTPNSNKRKISKDARSSGDLRKGSEGGVKMVSLKLPGSDRINMKTSVSDHCIKRHESLRKALLAQNIEMPSVSDVSLSEDPQLCNTAV